MNKKYITYTLILGMIAGLAFSLALWGYEMILLIGAHVAYPWLPGAVGTIACVLLCTLAALFTRLAKRALLGIVFWVVAAILISGLMIAIPIGIAPGLMKLFEPGLQSRLPALPYYDMFWVWIWTDAIWLSIFFAILGLLQNTLVEQAVPAYTPASHLTPYFVFVPVMMLASVMASNMINEQLRAPLLATDRLIQFAVANQNTTIDPEVANAMHLGALNTVSDLINRPRRLFLGNYDGYFGQVDVLIDFGGTWVDCSVIYRQPSFCQTVPNP